jgi:hypothetical protein|eukprot:4733308-Prymnesium_polylepis.2
MQPSGRTYTLLLHAGAVFLHIAVNGSGHEVAFESAVLGRLRHGLRVFLLRGSLGTRIELCYLFAQITRTYKPFTSLVRISCERQRMSAKVHEPSPIPLACVKLCVAHNPLSSAHRRFAACVCAKTTRRHRSRCLPPTRAQLSNRARETRNSWRRLQGKAKGVKRRQYTAAVWSTWACDACCMCVHEGTGADYFLPLEHNSQSSNSVMPGVRTTSLRLCSLKCQE